MERPWPWAQGVRWAEPPTGHYTNFSKNQIGHEKYQKGGDDDDGDDDDDDDDDQMMI